MTSGDQAAERYGDHLFSHRSTGERERLALMAEALDAQTAARIRALAPKPDGRFLEIGAGLGTTARDLARSYRTAQVLATDLATEFLEELDEPNLTVLQHDVTTDDFPEAGFDLIHARWVLTNLREREEVLRRVVRWLAPGGWLLLEDGVGFAVDSSPHAGYRRTTLACVAAVQQRIGVDGRGEWGRRYPAQLVEAGLVDCGSTGDWPGFRGGEPWPMFWRTSFERVLPDVLAAGDLSEAEAAAGMAALADPAFQDMGITTVAAWGRRPPG
ncbi:class I SAM-dependent methyltransferase [Actinomadura barringtoniae]|uniref:Class I SAM-dependent methyltransferase n=1 Tax=Actinomadura barringtoniae TaxID=1427535 RepID=A0A939PNQ4_9ACTN|nr:class I SAM-dependent methyltransferase [Actinomadura barringtoniae]MBO2453438.1 class I SAM-dependent methyltransferase [Actinomadura barringtoniae]